jgi:hypothetical protein
MTCVLQHRNSKEGETNFFCKCYILNLLRTKAFNPVTTSFIFHISTLKFTSMYYNKKHIPILLNPVIFITYICTYDVKSEWKLYKHLYYLMSVLHNNAIYTKKPSSTALYFASYYSQEINSFSAKKDLPNISILHKVCYEFCDSKFITTKTKVFFYLLDH